MTPVISWRHSHNNWWPRVINWRPPDNNWCPRVINWRPPQNNWWPIVIIWRPPVINWRPPHTNWCPLPLYNKWWPPVIIWRPPVIYWMPPHDNWWPRVINWGPPYDNWWPPVIIWMPSKINWRIVSEKISGSRRTTWNKWCSVQAKCNAVDLSWGFGGDIDGVISIDATTYSDMLAMIMCSPAALTWRPRGALGDHWAASANLQHSHSTHSDHSWKTEPLWALCACTKCAPWHGVLWDLMASSGYVTAMPWWCVGTQGDPTVHTSAFWVFLGWCAVAMRMSYWCNRGSNSMCAASVLLRLLWPCNDIN